MKRILLGLLLLWPLSASADIVCSGTANSCGGGGSGTVTGPGANCTDNAIARWDGATTTVIQCSDAIMDDSENVTGLTSLTSTTLVGSTTSCGGGASAAANSVCITGNTITAEGATADDFETLFAFGDATADQTLTCTGAASSLGCVVASPTVGASAVAGNALALTASPAVAGDTNAGAAAGGGITLTTGAADRLTSGNANGGDITLVTGAGIGTGTAGQVVFPVGVLGAPSLTFSGDTNTGFYWPSTDGISITTGGTERIRITTGFSPNGIRTLLPLLFGPLGTPTAGLDIVTGAQLKVTDATSTGIGSIAFALTTETVATTKTPAVTESGELYTNGADVDGLTITLTNDPTVGTCFEFAIVATVTSGAFTIVANTGETLIDGASACGTSFNGTALGNTARICAVSGGSGGQWFVMSKNGSWTCTA